MALIRHGSFDDFSVSVHKARSASLPGLGALRTFGEVQQATRAAQPVPVTFDVSGDPRGLTLKTLRLTQGFEGLLQNLFNKTNEVYFLAWSWDLSGAPVVEYPGAVTNAATCIIPMKVGQVREFLGAGIALFPARRITAGLTTRIMLWESDHGARDFGKAMSEVASTIKASELSNLLSGIAQLTNVTAATVGLVKDAVLELTGAIGEILKKNSDDCVDFFEGYYPAAVAWTRGDELYKGNACEISITRLAGA